MVRVNSERRGVSTAGTGGFQNSTNVCIGDKYTHNDKYEHVLLDLHTVRVGDASICQITWHSH